MVERYTSPDGLLQLVLVESAGDCTVGFRGGSWRADGDALVGEYELLGVSGLTALEAVRRFVDEVLNDQIQMVIATTPGGAPDLWPTWDPQRTIERAQPNEQLQLRTWNKAADPGG